MKENASNSNWVENDEKLRRDLMQRFAKAQRPLGRLRLNLHIQWKRFTWRAVIKGSHTLKRAFDVLASLAALILLSPLFLLLIVLVELDGGPIIYAQRRIGRGGKEFKMYKFRSMIVNADKLIHELRAKNDLGDSVTFKMKRDPRMTPIGKWLRKLSLDELPQFLNVLAGDMSLVGPRPCLPREIIHYTLEQRRRLDVLPGITGLWQISGRADIGFEGQLLMDARYLENRGFWEDLRILILTVPAVLFGKGAY